MTPPSNPLPASMLQDFRDWCDENHIRHRPGRDPKQVLQIQIGTAWHVLGHDSVPEALAPIINRFNKDYL